MQDATINRDQLPQDLVGSHSLIIDLLKKLNTLQTHFDAYLRRQYNASDKSNPNQLRLFEDVPVESPVEPAVDVAEPNPEPATEPVKPRKKGHGRKKLPANLERKKIIHELSEAQRSCPCCGEQRVKIGEEISEKLDIVPARFFIVEHIRHKYGCPGCSKTKAENVDQNINSPSVISIAPMPPTINEKGVAESWLLAHVIVNKYTDHLPLARQESIFKRQGVHVSRKTMCDWSNWKGFALSCEIINGDVCRSVEADLHIDVEWCFKIASDSV